MPNCCGSGAPHPCGQPTNDKEILVLCHRLPYPPEKGDKIRSYNILRQLSQWGWRIHLGTLTDDHNDFNHLAVVESLCASFKMTYISPWRKLFSFIGAIRGTSLSVEYFRSRALQQFVDRVFRGSKIQAVLAVCAPMAEYVHSSSGPLPPKMILDLMDVDSEKWRAYGASACWPMNWIYTLESRLLARYEESAGTFFGQVMLVSQSEAALLRPRAASRFEVHGISNGVDTDYFSLVGDDVEMTPNSMIFCGVMDYAPNVDAVCWFCDEVFPLIQKRLPDATFWIVGSKPNARVRALEAKPGVRVTGAVADVRHYVWSAAVSVAPLRLARGVQNKVLEAMAMGKAVVVTPQALEGIEATPNVDLALAPDDPQAFAAAVLDMLADAEKRREMGRRARRRMECHYSWEAQLAPLLTILE